MNQMEYKNAKNSNLSRNCLQCQFMTPKALIQMIDILKQQGISTMKMQFGFISDAERKKFLELYREEESNEYYREVGPQKESVFAKMYKRKQDGVMGRGCRFSIGSYLRSEVFLKAYQKKLQKLQTDNNVKIYQLKADIYIESEREVKLESIIFSQVKDMFKKLQVYVFFNKKELWNMVINSEEFKRKLEKIGIYYHARQNKNKNVAFYSLHFKPEQIRKQVLKQISYQPRILRIFDTEISNKFNLRIFNLVVKSIRSTIDKMRQIYECNLEVNHQHSCFVLHSKNEIFAEQPVAEISKVVSDLFIFSFPSRNSRTFVNLLKRNAKKYPFISGNHCRNRIFCCIDRRKLKNKKDLLEVFSIFLDQLNEKSRLTIHLKPNCILQQNLLMPVQILDLTEECKLDVQCYDKIMNSKKFNIVVKPKLFNTQDKKSEIQLQYSNFLLKLLMMKEEEQQVTSDELNQSLLNGSMVVVEDQTEDSGQTVRKEDKKKNKGMMERKCGRNIENIQFIDDQKKEKIFEYKRVERKAKGSQNEITGQEYKKQVYTKELAKHEKKEANPVQKIGQPSETQEEKEAQKIPGFSLAYSYKAPKQLDSGQAPFETLRKERDRDLQSVAYDKFLINIKAWKIKLNYKFFNFTFESEALLNKQKCYLVSNLLISDNNPIETPVLKSFSSLIEEETAYIIYISEDKKILLPTHIIQKF